MEKEATTPITTKEEEAEVDQMVVEETRKSYVKYVTDLNIMQWFAGTCLIRILFLKTQQTTSPMQQHTWQYLK